MSGAAGTVRLLSQLPFPWLITPCEPPGAMGALCKPSADQLLPGAEKLGALVITLCLRAGNASSFLRLHRSVPCFLLLHPKAKNVTLLWRLPRISWLLNQGHGSDHRVAVSAVRG